MQPASTEPLTPTTLSIVAGELRLESVPTNDSVLPRQQLDRLAQIDTWGTDIDLLFFESSSSLSMTTLRFLDKAEADRFLQQVTHCYARLVGTSFPLGWLGIHSSPRPGER